MSHLLKQPVFVVITACGCLFVFAGIFKIDDITKLAVSPHAEIHKTSVIIGVFLILIGIAMFVVTQTSLTTLSVSSVTRTPVGFSIAHGGFTIETIFSRIEEIQCSEEECLVALPANEFFDDECINDSGSSLGAYMQHHFRSRVPEIQSLIKEKLDGLPCKNVEKEPGRTVPSYGVGQCVFLDRPLSSAHRVAMVSVTTKRANQGLQARARYIFDAIASIHKEMANHRLTRLYIPLLGSGHGGVKHEMSLVCMLIAFAELHRRESGHHLKNVNILVFRRDENTKPSIPENRVRRALAFASRLLED